MERLRRQVELTADPVLSNLLDELRGYPAPISSRPRRPANGEAANVFVPVQFASEAGALSFFSTTTVFGTPVDITLSELAIEAFFPADQATAEALRTIMGSG